MKNSLQIGSSIANMYVSEERTQIISLDPFSFTILGEIFYFRIFKGLENLTLHPFFNFQISKTKFFKQLKPHSRLKNQEKSQNKLEVGEK